MNKKKIITMALTMVLAAAMLAGCGKAQTVYDAGEYGKTDPESQTRVLANEGYKFLGWSEPQVDGKITTYKAQYAHREYYLSEVKEIYEFPQFEDNELKMLSKTTDLQTNEVTEKTAHKAVVSLEASVPVDMLDYQTNGHFAVSSRVLEFDTTVKIEIKDSEYNLEKEFNLHFVRNRIAVESLETAAPQEGVMQQNTIPLEGSRFFRPTVIPENASFKSNTFIILRVERKGKALTEAEIKEVAYFDTDVRARLYTTNKAMTGDVIRVQAVNERDPQIKSNILDIVRLEKKP